MPQSIQILPCVAILLAVYNGEIHLNALIHSLMEQDYDNICIHIRDNCSTDKTKEILMHWKDLFPEKIMLYFADKNEGVIKNFGELTLLADMPYFMYCDGDDVWHPSKVSTTLEKMLELEKEQGSLTPLLVHTDLIVVDENLNEIAPSFWKYSCVNTHKKCQQLPRLLVQNHVTGCTMMINRALRDLAIPIPLNCMMHDWWLALIAATFGKVVSLPVATIKYRQHSANDTGAKSYGFLSYYKQRIKGRNSIQNKKMEQVHHFLEHFKGKISEENFCLFEAYLRMQKAPLPQRLFLMFRHGFFKSGILRNFILNH